MRYQITAPVKGYDGEVGGVRFVAGRAEADDTQTAALAYCRRRGYTVEPLDQEGIKPDTGQEQAKTRRPAKKAAAKAAPAKPPETKTDGTGGSDGGSSATGDTTKTPAQGQRPGSEGATS